jgi:hypothetical protein
VDGTLLLVAGRRPTFLRRSDLPEAARAIVAYQRGRARVQGGQGRGIGYVHFMGPDVDVVIRREDWLKILPFIQAGTFEPQLVPVGTPTVRDPAVHFASGTLDLRDRVLYARVLGVLQGLFSDDYPSV